MELVYLALLIAFTSLVLLCYIARKQGKFNQVQTKHLQEIKSILIVLELNQNRPIQGRMCGKVSGRDLVKAFDNSIPPRI